MAEPVHRTDIDASELMSFVLSIEELSLGPAVLLQMFECFEPWLDLELNEAGQREAVPPRPYLYPH